MKLFLTLFLSGLLLTATLFAQDAPSREIGLRLTDFNSFGLIYKKQIRENTYRRYRLAFGNLSANFIQSNTLIGCVCRFVQNPSLD